MTYIQRFLHYHPPLADAALYLHLRSWVSTSERRSLVGNVYAGDGFSLRSQTRQKQIVTAYNPHIGKMIDQTERVRGVTELSSIHNAAAHTCRLDTLYT